MPGTGKDGAGVAEAYRRAGKRGLRKRTKQSCREKDRRREAQSYKLADLL